MQAFTAGSFVLPMPGKVFTRLRKVFTLSVQGYATFRKAFTKRKKALPAAEKVFTDPKKVFAKQEQASPAMRK